MSRLHNDPASFVEEAAEGFASAHRRAEWLTYTFDDAHRHKDRTQDQR